MSHSSPLVIVLLLLPSLPLLTEEDDNTEQNDLKKVILFIQGQGVGFGTLVEMKPLAPTSTTIPQKGQTAASGSFTLRTVSVRSQCLDSLQLARAELSASFRLAWQMNTWHVALTLVKQQT